MKTEIKVIGFKGDIEKIDLKVCSYKETRQQIEELKKYESLLVDEDDGDKITWGYLDDVSQPLSLFQAISLDRKRREGTLMADRPLFVVCTLVDSKVVRLEFYEGHDELKQVYDVRSKKLYGKDLPKYLDSDPQAYDPAKFLEETFGFPKEFTKPIIKEMHKEKKLKKE